MVTIDKKALNIIIEPRAISQAEKGNRRHVMQM